MIHLRLLTHTKMQNWFRDEKNWPSSNQPKKFKIILSHPWQINLQSLVAQLRSIFEPFCVKILFSTSTNLVWRNLWASSLLAVHFMALMLFRITTVIFTIFIFRSDLYFYFLANAASLAFPYFSIFVLTSLKSTNN